MKKLIALLLSLLMTLPLASCGGMAEIALDLLDEALSAVEASDASQDASQDTSQEEEQPEKTTAVEDSGSDMTEVELSDSSVEYIDSTDDSSDSSQYTTSGSDTQSTEYVGGDFTLDEDGTYTSYEDVALYIVTYDHLPDNFMTKKESQELGWTGGGLDNYAYGMCIGGDRFGNKEGSLPKAKGRTYYECDIDTLHANKRGAERIVYSNDGLVYYTDDHYETFTLLYGEE